MSEFQRYVQLIESNERSEDEVSSNDRYPFTWNEKTILWTNGDFYIATGKGDNSYLTLWTDDNKRIGVLDATVISHRNRKTDTNEKRMQIDSVDIDKKHRGNSLGTQLYVTLLQWLPSDVAGIYSYLPNRSNKRQVPGIYSKLKGYVADGDHAYIDKK